MAVRAAPAGLPMTAFVSDAEMLDPARFASRHGAAFLVVLGGAVPARAAGLGPKAGNPNPVRARTATGERVLVFPIVRAANSTREEVTIGRGDGNDIMLRDETVADLHAVLIPAGSGYCVQDEGSRNGTAVEGIPVAARGKGPPTELRLGQTVKLGGLDTSFVDAAGLMDLVHRLKGAY